ncbi:hypothetical protein P3T36_006043 [Kitasatospora sp. MAP12-15]|uniref:hypothetical protein n=1 Tax=unclassified Kitasatospora TaxID=2633591 RepID=UPI0024741085|nr:hypothetical protein [Kitasatospora sp. MAP12-44]MDH6109034.1 hypothetical protein [Kitasatospora sp. MAP12-44]
MPAARRRMADEVRSAAVRAVLFLALTLVLLTITALASFAHSWVLTPGLMASGVGVFAIAYCLLDIMVSRQIAEQRRRGPGRDSPIAQSRARGSRR